MRDALLRGVEETFTLLEFTVRERKEGEQKRKKKRNKTYGRRFFTAIWNVEVRGLQHCGVVWMVRGNVCCVLSDCRLSEVPCEGTIHCTSRDFE